MKPALAIAGICGVLVLDWLALDDITTGRQPTFVLTRRVLPRTRESVEFYSGDLAQLVNRRLRPSFRSIWFVGGGAARLRSVTRCYGEVRPDMRPRGTP